MSKETIKRLIRAAFQILICGGIYWLAGFEITALVYLVDIKLHQTDAE